MINTDTYLLVADGVLLVYVLMVVFLILGLLATLIGGVIKWQ